jgi:hypothetical protein
MSQTIEIKTGSELDMAVAEAIGWRQSGEAWVQQETPLDRECWVSDFRPSTDLNAAFAAAEKAGLFSGNHLLNSQPNNHCAMLYKLSDDLWHVSGCCGERYSDATTPALAICAAILKTKG